MKRDPTKDIHKTLRYLIVAVVIILLALILAVSGLADQIPEVFRYLPFQTSAIPDNQSAIFLSLALSLALALALAMTRKEP